MGSKEVNISFGNEDTTNINTHNGAINGTKNEFL